MKSDKNAGKGDRSRNLGSKFRINYGFINWEKKKLDKKIHDVFFTNKMCKKCGHEILSDGKNKWCKCKSL